MSRSRSKQTRARKSRSKEAARSRRPRGTRLPRLRRIAVLVVGVAFAGGWICAGQVVELDRIVLDRFEGQRFRVPSRVYTAPTIVYPGLDWKLVDLPATLQRLGYRRVTSTRNLEPGQYLWGSSRVRLFVHPFQHPSRPEPGRDVVLRLVGDVVEEIRALPEGREMGALLLQPEQLGAYYGPNREQRELVVVDQIPRHLVYAVLAVEDQRFESHPGIDMRRVAGAFVANLKAGSIRQGGSTLTQQLVKNFFLTPERTLTRKLREAVMALLVESRYSKNEILQAYLNEIYLGQRGATAIHGVGEAARLYFGKSADELSLAESALIAAIIQSPNGISPFRDPRRATARRNLVLELMEGQGRIDAEQLAAAQAAPLQLASVHPDRNDARYFLDLLRRQLSSAYDTRVLTSKGLRIYSTLDRRVQGLASKALREGIEQIERDHPNLVTRDSTRAVQGCIVAMRPQTGEILALVGGRDYGISQFDRCSQARRQTGSVFKPFVYIAALEPQSGRPLITLADRLDDSPLEISTPSGVWRPENYDKKFHGLVPVREALERSFNVATARLAQDVGIDRVVSVARRMGITSPMPHVPSLALGTAEVSPLEVARAYATLASGGVRPEIQAIEDLVDGDGHTLERRTLRFERVLDSGTAYLATSLLEGVAERGTAARVRSTGLRGPIAAKTGTTDGEHDLWFVGFTPELVAVVWIGFDEPRSLGIPSSAAALPIWRRFVRELTGGQIRGAFLRPSDVEVVEIDPASGALALAGCPDRRSEIFLRGTLPEAVCPSGATARRRSDASPVVRRRFFDWLRDQL